jgi:hypothetical protein
MVEEEQRPLCEKCGGKMWKRGFETYAIPPHKRRKFTCKSCGHNQGIKLAAQDEPSENTGAVNVVAESS